MPWPNQTRIKQHDSVRERDILDKWGNDRVICKMLLVSENFATDRKIADFDKDNEDIGNKNEKRHYIMSHLQNFRELTLELLFLQSLPKTYFPYSLRYNSILKYAHLRLLNSYRLMV